MHKHDHDRVVVLTPVGEGASAANNPKASDEGIVHRDLR